MPSDVRHRIAGALRLARRNPLALAREAACRCSRSLIFVADLRTFPEPVSRDGLECRALHDEEVRAFPHDSNRERLERLGVNLAYGVFVGGQLGHISWMIDRPHEDKTGRVISLRPDEVEVTACFTAPEFRGKGLYPIAIQHMAFVARKRGFSTAFMKVRPQNSSSIRGIQKAGFRRAGTVWHAESRLLPHGEVMIRSFRLGVSRARSGT